MDIKQNVNNAEQFKINLQEQNPQSIQNTDEAPKCKFFVKRKKRFCRITPATNEEYCGEHLPVNTEQLITNPDHLRIVCPLDSTHTVYEKNLKKHLKVCNAAIKDRPPYIVPGLNAGQCSDKNRASTDFKLADIEQVILDKIIDKVNKLYEKLAIEEQITELIVQHQLLEKELSNEIYGNESRKHLIQTSAIIGYLEHYGLLNNSTSFVEYGCGKGQVSFYLAQAIANFPESNVVLIDRASLRHKKDNQIDDAIVVERVRADIADFDITKHDLIQKSKRIVGLGKHLCGAATDFAIRCAIHGNNAVKQNESGPKTEAILIALCCHHRCDWIHFVGKDFFIENDVTPDEFVLITKMVGWAICGTGMSRERRKKFDEQQQRKRARLALNKDKIISDSSDDEVKGVNFELRNERQEIGRRCKRLIDFARIRFFEGNGFKCYLKKYVESDITLENICLVALLR